MGAMEEADREVVWGRWTVMGEKGKGIDPKSEWDPRRSKEKKVQTRMQTKQEKYNNHIREIPQYELLKAPSVFVLFCRDIILL